MKLPLVLAIYTDRPSVCNIFHANALFGGYFSADLVIPLRGATPTMNSHPE